MPSPLTKYPDTTAILPPAYFGSIGYYATMAAHGIVIVDRKWRYDKRKKSTHRCTIADTHGTLMLTVPITKPERSHETTWNEINVSTHGEWWNVHLTALESAYGRTPFFEFFIDKFIDFFRFSNPICEESLMDLDCNTDKAIREILGIDNTIGYSTENIVTHNNITDYRSSDFNFVAPVNYYQVRQSHYGFIPNLSILDLIFNMGTESPLILKKMIDNTSF